MNSRDTVIHVEKLAKCYRIGFKEEMNDSLGAAILNIIKSPINNFRKYRSLYKFNDIKFSSESEPDDDLSDIFWALKDVSFKVNQGEVLGIIGRNGAGKSTLLKILCQITCPTRGRALIYGKVSSLLEVGTGFHNELTGRENVYLNGTVLGMSKKEVDRKFDEIVAFSGVERFIDTPVKRYSSGMMVRLAFAVAAHMEPEILIIDEVLAVGDTAFQKKCINKMENVGRQGRTILFVSHNMSAITRLCGRAVLLESGRLIKDGLPQEVIGHYLKSGQEIPGQRKWPDPSEAPGSEYARLRSVSVRNGDGQVVVAVDIHRPFVIEMEYEILKPGLTYLPHFMLYNSEHVCIFVAIDQDEEWLGRPRPKGHYVSTVWIPGDLLNEGTVLVAAIVRTVDPDILHIQAGKAVAFEVFDSIDNVTRGGYSRGIPGIVRPKLMWTTQFSPD